MENLTSSRPEYQELQYQELPTVFPDSEHGPTTFPDTLTFRWWQFLCAVSVANILLWALAAWGLSREADGYQFRQLLLSGLFVAACAFRSVLPRVDVERF